MVLDLCIEILNAYGGLHEQDVVHGDVHPRNIIVEQDGQIKIVDFGLARIETDGVQRWSAQRGGIPHFFDPEFAECLILGRQPPVASKLIWMSLARQLNPPGCYLFSSTTTEAMGSGAFCGTSIAMASALWWTFKAVFGLASKYAWVTAFPPGFPHSFSHAGTWSFPSDGQSNTCK